MCHNGQRRGREDEQGDPIRLQEGYKGEARFLFCRLAFIKKSRVTDLTEWKK